MKTFIVHRDGLTQPELVNAESVRTHQGWVLFYIDDEVYLMIRDAVLVADKAALKKSGSTDEVNLELVQA